MTLLLSRPRTRQIDDDATRRQFLWMIGAAGLAGCTGSDDPSALPIEASPSPTTQTRTVRHALGETQVPLNPQRPVGLFYPTFLALLGLDLAPIATDDAAITNMAPLVPWLPDGFEVEEMTTLGPPNALDLERLTALDPDLVVSIVPVGEEIYPQLSEIAPTVLFDWEGTGAWREHVEVIAAALGRESQLDDLRTRYRDAVTGAQLALGSTDATIAVVRLAGDAGSFRIDLPSSFTGQVLTDVGFTVLDNGDAGEVLGTFAELSMERLDVLAAADVIVVGEYNGEAAGQAEGGVDTFAANPLWPRLPAVARDAVATVDAYVWLGANYPAAIGLLQQLPATVGRLV